MTISSIMIVNRLIESANGIFVWMIRKNLKGKKVFFFPYCLLVNGFHRLRTRYLFFHSRKIKSWVTTFHVA
jgi:hypothetical protein